MAASEHSLAFVERRSVLNRIYPLVKLAWVFTVAVGLFLYRTPLPGAVMFILILSLAILLGRIPVRHIQESSQSIFLLGLLLMFFHFFTDPGKPVIQLVPLVINDNGLVQ